MSVADISYDIPGSSVHVGIASQFHDYAVRRHLVKGHTDQTSAQDALHTAQGASWAKHHIIPNLPLQKEVIARFGRNAWIVEQVYARRKTSGWRSEANGKRQEIRIGTDPVPVFIRADASRTNGLPFVDPASPVDFYMLQLDADGVESPYLPPAHHMFKRQAMRITDLRTYDSYPMSGGQFAAINKVNSDAITLSSVGLEFQPNAVLFLGGDFVMESDGTGTSGRWSGAYYFDAIPDGHYIQRAYWDTSMEIWRVENDLQYESTLFAPLF